MIRKIYLLFFLISIGTLCFAQKPNPAYRLPVTPDMPAWAKKLYRDDARVNVFELDKEFKEWKEEEEAEGRATEENVIFERYPHLRYPGKSNFALP